MIHSFGRFHCVWLIFRAFFVWPSFPYAREIIDIFIVHCSLMSFRLCISNHFSCRTYSDENSRTTIPHLNGKHRRVSIVCIWGLWYCSRTRILTVPNIGNFSMFVIQWWDPMLGCPNDCHFHNTYPYCPSDTISCTFVHETLSKPYALPFVCLANALDQ